MAITTTTQLNPNPSNYFDRVLWDREKRFDVYNLFGQVRRLPMKNSKTLTVRRFDNLDDTPAVLTEGVTPALETVTKADVNIVIQEFGKVVALTDQVIIEDQSDDANEIADMLSQNMFEMLDKVTRNTLAATSTQFDCVNGVNGQTTTEITLADQDVVVDWLLGNNGKRFTPDIRGTLAFGSNPVEAAFWAIINIDIRKDVRSLSAFFPTSQYPRDEALQSELGSVDEVRYVMSSAGYMTSGSPDIYYNMYFAQNAYGIADIDEVATEMIIKPLGWGEDYLNQRQTMGWKGFFGAAVVVDEWMAVLRCTKSDA